MDIDQNMWNFKWPKVQLIEQMFLLSSTLRFDLIYKNDMNKQNLDTDYNFDHQMSLNNK